jgi:hypothetical protein
MSAKKKTSRKKKKSHKPKTIRKPKSKSRPISKRKPKPQPTLKDGALTAREAAAAPDDPIGACQFTDNTGQITCVDNITKTECAKLRNSVFLVGETCE